MERLYEATLTGKTIMMHRDNIAGSGLLKRWEKDPKNRAKSIAGDDRIPAWRWIGALYHDGTHVALPADLIMACILNGHGSVWRGLVWCGSVGFGWSERKVFVTDSEIVEAIRKIVQTKSRMVAGADLARYDLIVGLLKRNQPPAAPKADAEERSGNS